MSNESLNRFRAKHCPDLPANAKELTWRLAEEIEKIKEKIREKNAGKKFDMNRKKGEI